MQFEKNDRPQDEVAQQILLRSFLFKALTRKFAKGLPVHTAFPGAQVVKSILTRYMTLDLKAVTKLSCSFTDS